MIASISEMSFSWQVHPFQLANFTLLCLLFALVSWQHRELRRLYRGNSEQIKLASVKAGQAVTISQRTDERIADAYHIAAQTTNGEYGIPVIGIASHLPPHDPKKD